MAEDKVKRKLAAVMSADVVGYSKLMGRDEEGTLAALKGHLDQSLAPKIAEHQGRVVKFTGDGVLAEFGSAVNAVRCAVAFQREMAERNAGAPGDVLMEFRVGINLGDIIIDPDDIHGDGVNIAVRLESLAPTGGICLAASVYDQVRGKLDVAWRDLGLQDLKNIDAPVHAYEVRLDDAESPAPPAGMPIGAPLRQEIQFCTADDGVRIAYATVGQGPPIVKAANWLNHLEFDWESPVTRHWFRALAQDHTLVRYDARGNGLSDWDAEELSLDSFVRDLETVVDAAGLERFPLLGISQGCAVSIAYAVRHPERVSRLVLYGGFARGWNRVGSAALASQVQALITLMGRGWGQDNPAFRQIFTSIFIPGATVEQMRWFNDLQRMTTSPEGAVRNMRAFGDFEATALLPEVRVPTLVLHARKDALIPFEVGRRIAAGISGARFVALESANHILLEDEPAWPKFLSEVHRFLAEEGACAT